MSQYIIFDRMDFGVGFLFQCGGCHDYTYGKPYQISHKIHFFNPKTHNNKIKIIKTIKIQGNNLNCWPFFADGTDAMADEEDRFLVEFQSLFH